MKAEKVSSTGLISFLRGKHLIAYTILILFAVPMILPFFWMVSTSFKVRGEVLQFPPTFLPQEPTIENYIGSFQRLSILNLYKNTLLVAVVKTSVMVFTSALMGYVFGKFEFKGRQIIFYSILSTMIIPFQVYMIPMYLMVVSAKGTDNYLSLVIPFLFSAYGIFLFRQFMFTIPNDLIEAARVDGCSELRIFLQLILPMTKPVLSALTIFYFLWNWNDFLWPLIVINDERKYLLPIGLATFVSEYFSDYGVSMAGATLSILPILIVFLILQKNFIQGITLTGLK